MKLAKFLLSLFFITFIALVYVYQQSEIYCLAYAGSKRQAMLANLLDKNNSFRYNINKLSSLTCLDNNILRNVDFEMPAVKQLVRMNVAQDNLRLSKGVKRRPNLVFSFFGRARQAEAEPLNR